MLALFRSYFTSTLSVCVSVHLPFSCKNEMKCYCSSFEIKHIERLESCLFDLLYTVVLDILFVIFLYMSRKSYEWIHYVKLWSKSSFNPNLWRRLNGQFKMLDTIRKTGARANQWRYLKINLIDSYIFSHLVWHTEHTFRRFKPNVL